MDRRHDERVGSEVADENGDILIAESVFVNEFELLWRRIVPYTRFH